MKPNLNRRVITLKPTNLSLPARLFWLSALAFSLGAPAALAAQSAPGQGPQGDNFKPCPLGTFECKSRPVSYALCKPNTLFEFYQPDLPHKTSTENADDTFADADHVDSSAPDIYKLSGHVTMQRYDQYLTSDSANYNDQTGAFDARGHVTWQDNSVLMSADRVHGSALGHHGQAENSQYQLLTSRGNGIAQHAQMRDDDHHHFQNVTYSTCEPGHELWQIVANDLTTDKHTGRGKARGAKIKLGKVPIMYFPYFNFPIDDRRQSGFLFPTLGSGGGSSFMLATPYYLNLAPNYDATLTPQLYTGRGLMMGGQFRYLFQHAEGQFDVDYLPNDRRAGDKRGGYERNLMNGDNRYLWQFKNHSRINRTWKFDTTIKRASDNFYFEDFNSLISGISTPSSLHSKGYFKGSGTWWDASLGADHYQNVDPDPDYRSTPYKRWPRGTFNADTALNRYLTTGVDSEFVAFRRDSYLNGNGKRIRNVEGNRLDIYPWIEANFQGAAWFVKPKLAWRYTDYHITQDPRQSYRKRNPSRNMPITSIDSGLIFERQTSLFKHKYTQTLEPRLYYLYVPYRNQDDIPVFDSRDMNFAWWQLFTPNRFSGADRQMNANNLTAALTTRFINSSGVEAASFSVGQIRYFSPQRVHRKRFANSNHYNGSEYVAQASFTVNDNWRLSSTYQWNPETRHPSVGTVQAQRRFGRGGLINFSYRYRNRYMEQFDTSAVIPINARWRMLAEWNYMLRDEPNKYNDHTWARGNPKTLSGLLGVEYDSCCIAVGLYGHHYVRNARGKSDNAVMLQVQFKGLGNFAPDTDKFLRRTIQGYQ